jgi:hypothetical protein
MPLPLALPWLLFAGFVLVILLVSYGFVKYFQDRHESEKLPTLVSTVSLGCILLSTFLVPVDIWVVSSTVDPHTGKQILSQHDIEQRTTVVAILYYALYGMFLLLASLVIPFTCVMGGGCGDVLERSSSLFLSSYFYFEEKDLETRTKHRVRGMSSSVASLSLTAAPDQVWAGFKYTIFLVLIVLILFIAGFFITGSRPATGSESEKYIEVRLARFFSLLLLSLSLVLIDLLFLLPQESPQ